VTLRGIVFDFDGVIANSEPLHFQGFREVLADEGVTLTEGEYYARYLGFDDAGAFEAIGADRGVRWPVGRVDILVKRKAVLLEVLEREQSVLFPGATAAIARLAAAGPLAIASGALRNEITRVLEREDLARYFAVVVGAEDTPASKPAPDPYLRAVELLDAAVNSGANCAEYVAIEDSQWGLESARAAGLRTVGITNSYPADQLSADLVVSTLDELTWELLKGLTGRPTLSQSPPAANAAVRQDQQ
jgi:HAD superfamily hydrolase (TIGR01509 family)